MAVGKCGVYGMKVGKKRFEYNAAFWLEIVVDCCKKLEALDVDIS